MLTSKIRRRLPIPDEPNDWIEFRALSGRGLEEAEETQQRKAIELAKLAGVEFLQAIEGFRQDAADAEMEADPLKKYDIETVLRKGIVAWSYEAKLTPQEIENLDADTRNWAAGEVLKLTEESQESRKRAV